jgi:hypothetical protein
VGNYKRLCTPCNSILYMIVNTGDTILMIISYYYMYHILNNGNYEGQDGHYQLYYSESDWTSLEYRKYHSVRSTEKYINY